MAGGAAYDVFQALGVALDGFMFGRKADLAEVDQIARRLGLDRNEASDRLHDIKEGAGLRGRKVKIDSDGTVRDPVSGDELGNLCDD
jgi:hypothetical protein